MNMGKPNVRGRLRGVQDIKTRTGSEREANLPHTVHLKIAALEMERARKQTERDAGASRIECLDSRIREIEREVATMLAVLCPPGARPACSPSAQTSRVYRWSEVEATGESEARESSRTGLKIRY